MNDTTDLNVDQYSQEDLLSLLDLSDTENVTYEDILNASNPVIARYTSEDNYDLANFFQQIQNKLLQDLDDDSDNDDIDNNNDDFNIQNVNSSQLGNLWSNQYKSQADTDPNQANKNTDRSQQINIFEQNGQHVMNKNQLGVNNNYQLPVAQGTINPNLKNTTTRIINIDSQYRDNIIPYNPDPDGPSSPTNYTLDLTDVLHNTISLEVTSFQIPFTWYLIDSVYQSNNCFWIDNSMVHIPSGNYSNNTLIDAVNTAMNSIGITDIDVSYNTTTGKTIFTNNRVDTSFNITFYDPEGVKLCNTSCKIQEKFNNNLGWILGFRGNTNFPPSDAVTNPMYGQLVYTLDISGNIGHILNSEAFIDTFGSKYFLLVLDDYNQNHLNKGLVGITPTQKIAEIPSYWNPGLKKIPDDCTTPLFSSTKTPTYVQNAPRKLTQAQLYTLNETTFARTQTKNNFITTPTTTDVLALIPLRLANNLSPGQQIIDDFNLDEAKRIYFGPVDIGRMRVRLVNDKGYTVNLNGNDWSFTLTATALYQY
jgi:hypothetical protein